MRLRPLLVTVALAASILPTTVADAAGGRFFNLLGVGQGSSANTLDLAAHLVTGQPPATFVNQLGMFDALLPVAPAVSTDALSTFFKPAPLGIAARASTIAPRAGVTITRDDYSVPHVTGVTRDDVMFGAGYAQAQDRLFFMDVLRHQAKSQLTSLIGPGENDVNLRSDAAQLDYTDYRESDLQRMLDATGSSSAEGRRVRRDLQLYTAGVNAFMDEARRNPLVMPGEYVALGKPIAAWQATDTVAILGLLNGYFGLGGGGELKSARVLQEARARFGAKLGERVYADFRERDNPEAPVVTTKRFPFDDPGRPVAAASAMPDRGTVDDDTHLRSTTGTSAASRGTASGLPSWLVKLRRHGLKLKHHASNAMLVRAADSLSGNPLLVAGPQVGFYSPAILTEIALQGPGINSRGGVVPGAGMYPIAGRAAAYAWSVTTAQGDNTDIFAERLCEPDGSRPSERSVHYRYKGRCVAMLRQSRELSWTPGPVDLTADPAAGPFKGTLEVARSVHGPIIARGTVRGAPVAFARARASYLNETRTAVGLSRMASGTLSGPRAFKHAAAQITGSYNWFYADSKHIAYLQSGLYPLRARGTHPDLPTWGTGSYDWLGFDAANFASRRIPPSRLPNAVDPASGYLISWNNKQAPGWRSSDADWQYGSVHRSQRLEKRVRHALAGRSKLDLGALAGIMGDAGTVDLRAQEVLPWLLRVIGDAPGAAAAPFVDALRSWERDGGHRRDRDGDGIYEHSAAVAIMDRWWTPLVRAIYDPLLGNALTDSIAAVNEFDYLPNHGPDTFYYGWYGYVDRDLRTLLKTRVAKRPARVACGRGRLAACRAVLLRTLVAAGSATTATTGGSLADVRVPSTCPVAERPSCDQLQFTAAGAIETPPIPWQDRGTFQQVIEFDGSR